MNILKFEGVSKEDKNTTLIDDIYFTLDKGQSIAIKCTEEIALTMMDMILGNMIPSKGSILLEDMTPKEYIKTNKQNIAVIYKEEGFYERLNIIDYLKFFHGLYDSDTDLEDVMARFALLDIAKNKIGSLTYSEKKRVSFARTFISMPNILLIQEPTLNLDRQSNRIIRENIIHMKSLGITILAFSIALEDTILLDGDSYTLNENGLKPIESEIDNGKDNQKEVPDEIQKETESKETNEIELPNIKIDKIPTKIDDKIILFNPMEINYIETLDGCCYINVGTEKFQCSLTLSNLEERLKHIGFFRCHRSYLVNLQRVREVITWTRNSYSLILDDKNKSSIPLSKGRMEELKQILNL
ncbi:LytTR family transcriptional regulator DNA-binding domain-containing protein [Vallitalea guaymasensis]|uniref:LytTR family transcriptional regulator DNA-binding domain-containing protein n=1 Tax=Vallitalea guaymasensis TaxID=1185412 RepID=UPI0027297AA3|nr:LytTR family transcriptional regulator DNA-binding domain-containing protein [Vallitalea guaymasensis]